MKPMLAATVETLETLKYPLLASPKLDGIRALVVNEQLVSRRLKPIPNEYVQKTFKHLPIGLDGELICGSPMSKTCFSDTTSAVMSQGTLPKMPVRFYVFDRVNVDHNFIVRQDMIDEWMRSDWYNPFVLKVRQTLIKGVEQLVQYEQYRLQQGYEGVMLRSFDGPYKFGRSTLREGYLMKLKRFEDSEAEILDVVELQHNNNEQTRDALGKAKRSSHKENMIAGNTMGSLIVRDIHSGVEFDLGSGFNDADRQNFWENKNKFKGLIVKYKFFPVGVKDKPRHPVFLGIRED